MEKAAIMEIVDDYSYSVYSGGLTKDYVEKIIEDLAKKILSSPKRLAN